MAWGTGAATVIRLKPEVCFGSEPTSRTHLPGAQPGQGVQRDTEDSQHALLSPSAPDVVPQGPVTHELLPLQRLSPS